jgi:hypothetical protein
LVAVAALSRIHAFKSTGIKERLGRSAAMARTFHIEQLCSRASTQLLVAAFYWVVLESGLIPHPEEDGEAVRLEG